MPLFCSRMYLPALPELCWSHPGGCSDAVMAIPDVGLLLTPGKGSGLSSPLWSRMCSSCCSCSHSGAPPWLAGATAPNHQALTLENVRWQILGQRGHFGLACSPMWLMVPLSLTSGEGQPPAQAGWGDISWKLLITVKYLHKHCRLTFM